MTPPGRPLAATARDYLELVQREHLPRLALNPALNAKGRVGVVAAGFVVRHLIQLLADVEQDLAKGEVAEVAIVYDQLVQIAAELIDRPAEAVFPALVELCDDPVARVLVDARGTTDVAALEALRGRILWITVTYRLSDDNARDRCDVERVVAVGYLPGPGELRPSVRRMTYGMSRDDLTRTVRNRLSKKSDGIHFQLYPRPDEAVAPVGR